MTFGKSLNYKRYWTPSWKIFIWLALATAVPFLPIVAVAHTCRDCLHPTFIQVVLRTLMVTAPFAFLGLITGLVRNQNATQVVGKAVGASYLDPSHPLTQRVHQLADRLQLPRPAVGVMPAANAFAVGRTPQEAAVIIGRPLLNRMSADELDAVIGHELGHIASGDMNRMQLATGFQLALDWFFRIIAIALGFALVIAAKTNSRHASSAQAGLAFSRIGAVLALWTVALGSTICICGLSRRREFYADAVGALLTTPDAMRSALRTIHHIGDRPLAGESEFGMLMFRGRARGLFTTHPTLRERLAALDTGDITARVERRFLDGPPERRVIALPESVQLVGMTLVAGLMAFVLVWTLLPR